MKDSSAVSSVSQIIWIAETDDAPDPLVADELDELAYALDAQLPNSLRT